MIPAVSTANTALGHYAAFTDESGLTHRYMIVGGISCRFEIAHLIDRKVREIRASSPYPQDSLQWKHLRAPKLDTYKRLIAYFFELNARHLVDFTAIVIDRSKLDHFTHNEGDGEQFFHKMLFSITEAKIRKYHYPKAIYLFHGERTSKFSLEGTRSIINAALDNRKRPNRLGAFYRPVHQLAYMDVSLSGPHQITDVLLGSVAFHWNAGMRKSPGSPKEQLAQFIQAEGPAENLGRATPWTQPHFDIWQFQLKGP